MSNRVSVIFLGTALLCLLLPGSLFSDEDLQIRIVGMGVPVRQSPNMSAHHIVIVQKGKIFDVLEKLESWYLIKLPRGRQGYVHKSVVEELAEGGEPEPEIPAKAAAEKSVPVVEPQVKAAPEKPDPAEKPSEKAMAAPPTTQPGISTIRPAPRFDKFSMVLVRSGYFAASDSAFVDIYGNGPVFGGEIRLGGRRVAGWLEGGYRERGGKFSFTGESTKVQVAGAELGVLYRIITGTISPYAGAGIGYYMFSEKNDPLGEAKQSQIGFCGAAGVSALVAGRLVFDLRLKYYTCSMKPADFNINIGGLSLDLGIGVNF